MKFNKFKTVSLILGALLLQGCTTAAILGTAAVATKVATDPRTVGTQIDDETLEEKVYIAMDKDPQVKSEARINVVSYSGKVLLVGQAPNNHIAQLATSLAEGVEGVEQVVNKIRTGEKISAWQISQDGLITTSIKSQILLDSRVKSTQIKVFTENGEAFLMGNVTKEQGQAALEVASKVRPKPTKVVDVFKYLN